MLEKTEAVLEQMVVGAHSVVFHQDPEQMEAVFPIVHLDVDAHVEMGSPETITVTIAPGDALNDEEE